VVAMIKEDNNIRSRQRLAWKVVEEASIEILKHMSVTYLCELYKKSDWSFWNDWHEYFGPPEEKEE
jgi:hypothetical protein